MTPDRTAEVVARWVRFYTRDLPAPIAQRRISEIDADLHDHIAHERAHGVSDRRIALGVLSRMVRGLAADASWRGQHAEAAEDVMKKHKTAYRSGVRVVLATGFILLLPLVAMRITDEVDWSVADFVLAGALLGGTGLLLELAARRGANLAYRAAAAAIGVAAIVVGEVDDAPGLVLFGGPAHLRHRCAGGQDRPARRVAPPAVGCPAGQGDRAARAADAQQLGHARSGARPTEGLSDCSFHVAGVSARSSRPARAPSAAEL
jgi:hypothetical protein